MILDDYYKGKIRKKLIKQYVKYSKIECWYWIGEIQKNGYGYIKLTNYNTSAYKRIHRVAAWIWLDFDLDSNLHILHKCNNKACLNPDHLYIGTHQDNMNDRKNNGNYKGIKGTKNFNAKLCNEDIKEIFEISSFLDVTHSFIKSLP